MLDNWADRATPSANGEVRLRRGNTISTDVMNRESVFYYIPSLFDRLQRARTDESPTTFGPKNPQRRGQGGILRRRERKASLCARLEPTVKQSPLQVRQFAKWQNGLSGSAALFAGRI